MAETNDRREPTRRRDRGKTIATMSPSRPLCECQHCPDRTHGGELGTEGTWTWHDADAAARHGERPGVPIPLSAFPRVDRAALREALSGEQR